MDVQRMRKSFDKVGSYGDEVPLFFYSHLFLSHPDTRAMFPISMMQQRDRLLKALGHIVSRVDELDELVPYLQQLGRDHRKFSAMAVHYPAVGASLIATLKNFAGDDWTPELEQDWAAAYDLVAKTMVDAAESDSETPPWWDAQVVAHERRTSDIAVIRLRTQQPLPYAPGQSISLQVDSRPRLWRYYSPAGAPRDDHEIELHVQAFDGAPVSSALVRHLRTGDVVRMGPAVGVMTLDPQSDRDLLLIAGGTGLAPLKALVEQVAQQDRPRRVHLFHGARTRERLYDMVALHELEQRHRWLHVTPVVSRDDTYEGERGLVGDVVLDRGPWGGSDVYIAGSPAMVRATTDALVADRTPSDRIRSEPFAPSWPGVEVEGEVPA